MNLAAERTDGLAANADTRAHHTRIHTQTHIHTHTHTFTHALTHAHTHTHTRARALTRTHARTHTRTHTSNNTHYKNIPLSHQRTTDRGKRIDILSDRLNNLRDCVNNM